MQTSAHGPSIDKLTSAGAVARAGAEVFVAGQPDRRASRALSPGRRALWLRKAWRGFTLIELMVVLMIGSVVFGMAILSVKTLDRGLQVDAQRLAQLLSFARDYAQMRGRPVRFEADGAGYRFIARNEGDWALILDEPLLRERVWDKPTQVRLERFSMPVPAGSPSAVGSPPNVVEFGRDYVDSPFTLWLAQDNQKVGIASNGLGKFQVQSEATQ